MLKLKKLATPQHFIIIVIIIQIIVNVKWTLKNMGPLIKSNNYIM